jgi:hypothetical protein
MAHEISTPIPEGQRSLTATGTRQKRGHDRRDAMPAKPAHAPNGCELRRRKRAGLRICAHPYQSCNDAAFRDGNKRVNFPTAKAGGFLSSLSSFLVEGSNKDLQDALRTSPTDADCRPRSDRRRPPGRKPHRRSACPGASQEGRSASNFGPYRAAARSRRECRRCGPGMPVGPLVACFARFSSDISLPRP